jgi:hypothetical protein
MQLSKIDGVALIVLGLMLFGFQAMVYYDAKTACYRPAWVFNGEARARNVSGTGNPWHSVFDGRGSYPRYAAASRRTRGKARHQGFVLKLIKCLEI